MKVAKSLTIDEEINKELERLTGYSSSEVINAILKKHFGYELNDKEKSILEKSKKSKKS